MKSKKVLTGVLSVTILSLSAVTALAMNTGDLNKISDAGQQKEIMPISGAVNAEKQSFYNTFTGTVKKMTDFEGVKGSKFVLVENQEGSEANIIVSGDTYIVNNAEITVGSVITGFYEANAPMLMIYPAQYNAQVVAVEGKEQNIIKVDQFDKDLLSKDNFLKLNISDNTEIISQDGKAFEGELANRKLVVLYGVSTRSIPAQTTPSKVVVLFEKAVPPIHDLTEEEMAAPIGDVSKMDIVVDNKKIENSAAYTNEKGTVMVPLRSIAEALGFDVKWNEEAQNVMVGKGTSITIGKDNYIYMKTAPIQLGTAPAIVEGRTYVPLSFFKEVMRMNNAYIFESQIVIDNGEIMN